MTVPQSLYFITILIVAGNVIASEWTYENEAQWSEYCKEGKHQSPIALSQYISKEKSFTPFIFEGYDAEITTILKNNGHSAEIRPKVATRFEIGGGGLTEIYQLDHLHFHWKSEHTVEGYRFPLEMHMVHYAKKYGNVSSALEHPRGVAVFAVLFDLSPDNDVEFGPLLSLVDSVKTQVNQQRELQQFTVKNFLPRDLAGFYRYDGSLTTPGCNEGILWTVFTNTIPISKEQVSVFEGIHTEHDTELKRNYRSLQELNDRTVYIKVSPIRSAARSNDISCLLMLSSLVVYYMMKS